MKFVTAVEDYEKFYEIRLYGLGKKTFFYEIDDDFPQEMIRPIFGHETTVRYR